MKTVILAGGFGTRLGEVTQTVPKPMVLIGGRPIVWHIMQHFAKYGFNDFVLALGYKSKFIKEYFANFQLMESDFTVDLTDGTATFIRSKTIDWKVTLVDTGLNTMTGGRLRRLRKILGDERFMLTYGDGVSDVNLNELLEFHKSHGKLVTVTSVHPVARFGKLVLEGDIVKSFKEKPQTDTGWINGGFFVFEPSFLDNIVSDETVLEKEPLEVSAANGQLMAYRHNGFWHCMDTQRDLAILEKMVSDNVAPWLT